MAASKAEQEAFNKLKTRFPKVSNEGIAQLMAIWQGEAPGFKTIKDEADPLYIAPLKNKKGEVVGTGADRWANTFQTGSQRNTDKFIKELLPSEINKLAKKYKLDPKGDQVKQLAEENLSAYSDKDWRELGSRWYQKQVDDRKAGKLSVEQFKEKVFGVQYKDANVRGLGAFQVTHKNNIVEALRKSGRTELADKVDKNPEEISKLRYDPDISWDITAGWIENNLIGANGDLKTKSFNDLANVVNAGEEKKLPENRAKKAKYFEDYRKKFNTPSAPQFNNLPPIGSGSTYSMTPQQMESKVYPPSISDAPYPEVSDRYKMELLSKPNVNSREGVKRVQAQIGADVDGIWGKQSQALFDIHNRQVYDNKVRPPSDTYRQEGFQRQAPRNPSLVEQGVNAIVPSTQAAAMPVAPPEKQYMTMEELLIDKDLMQNPLLFNDADAKRMWERF